MIRMLVLKTFLVFLFFAISFGSAQARQGASIYGVVSDSTLNEPILGANIYIDSLERGAASDIDGGYEIRDIPSGSYRIRVTYIGYFPKELFVAVGEGERLELNILLRPTAIVGEEVTVLAQAAGQIAAIKQQLESNTIVNVVSKERLSELPDNNAAESVARLPGVSVQRNAGEASKVVVRGLSPKFNSITVNGVRIPGTDPNDRSVDLSIVPSEVLDGIEVFKALTPDKDGDAVGGTVNLLVKKASPGYNGNASLEYGYNELTEEFGQYKASFNLSNRFLENKLGVLVTGSTSRQNRSSELFDNDFLFNQADSSLRTENLNLADTEETRDRYGASVALDYSDSFGDVYLSSFFGRTDRDQLRRRKRYRVGNTRTEYDIRDRERFEQLYTNSLRGEHRLNSFDIDWQLSHSFTLGKQPFGNYARFQELSAYNNGLIDDGAPELIPTFARNNLEATWFQYGLNETSRYTDRDLTAEINLTYNFEVNSWLSGKVKTGAKIRDKDRRVDENEVRTDFAVVSQIGQANPDLFELYNNTHIAISNFSDPNYSSSGLLSGVFDITPGLDADKINDFYATYTDSYEVNRERELADYDAGETISAGYIMSELELGTRFVLLGGFRYEATDNFYVGNFGNLRGNLGQDGTLIDTTGGQNYWELLPQVHLKFTLNENISIRLAYTESLSRPDYYNLVPFERINRNEFEITRGNPDLEHTKAVNYDAFISFYNSRFGYLSIGAFYKELTDIDYIRVTRLTEGEFDNYELTAPVNAEGTTTVKGFEVDIQSDLRFLPKPLDGFIISANLALIESETFFPFFLVGPRSPDPPFQPTLIDTVRAGRLPGQPDATGSLTIGYEVGLFSARFSLAYQESILEEISTQSVTDELSDGFSFWDFRLNQSFKQVPNLTFFVNVNNLTSESEREFIGSGLGEARLSRDFRYGLNATSGIRYKF